MKHKIGIYTCILTILCTISFAQDIKINSGHWRGNLMRTDGINIPFSFQMHTVNGKTEMLITNANDTLVVNDFKKFNDSILITLPFFDAEFMVKSEGDKIKGRWTRHLPKSNTYMPFEAVLNQNRFNEDHQNELKLNNTWDVKFIDENTKDSSEAIGQFNCSINNVTGTFLTTTGDYRFLEGIYNGGKIKLSTFDGSHAYLVLADFDPKTNTISNGIFYAGLTGKENWSGILNPEAELPDAEKLTFLKPGYQKIQFQLPDLNNNVISLADAKYQHKVVLLQIMGSWCPNCLDESKLMAEVYDAYHSKGLEIIGLCFEKSDDINVIKNNINNFKKQLQIKYPLLIAGNTKKGSVNNTLPMLANFVAFPTLILIDRNGNVQSIHTGYSGPATGKFYLAFKKHFIENLEKYLNEK
jgi:peroxiredoxin